MTKLSKPQTDLSIYVEDESNLIPWEFNRLNKVLADIGEILYHFVWESQEKMKLNHTNCRVRVYRTYYKRGKFHEVQYQNHKIGYLFHSSKSSLPNVIETLFTEVPFTQKLCLDENLLLWSNF